MPLLLIIFVLLLLSAFFSGAETAFFSLPRIYLKKLENSKSASAKRILNMLRQPRQLLVTILLGNTFVNMGISSLSALVAIRFAKSMGVNTSMAVTLQVIVTTLVIVTFCEIIPKLVALSTANDFARIVSLPLQITNYVLFLPVWLVDKLSLLISSRQNSDKHLMSRLTAEEFHNLIQSEHSKHSLDENEKQMLVGLFRFREAKLTEIYVPRVKVQAIEANQTLDGLRDLIITSGHSRIPVYRETIDDIIGVIYVKDLLLFPEKKSITELMRPAWFVTENMKVQTLLNQFKTKKVQMAVVVDEYGGTSGIISLEDILEEIVGEIHDEYDVDETPELVRVDAKTCRVRGVYNIRQFNQEFNAAIDADEYDNVAEFLLSQFNHVPAAGEVHLLDNALIFKVLESDGRSIKLVEVTQLEEEII
ncbi:MAG: hemolysin family protein [Candidatus Cloacimonetes bacterium]|nr:hemolysin family protein [Candidatus Cloacimonadota bacterium]